MIKGLVIPFGSIILILSLCAIVWYQRGAIECLEEDNQLLRTIDMERHEGRLRLKREIKELRAQIVSLEEALRDAKRTYK